MVNYIRTFIIFLFAFSIIPWFGCTTQSNKPALIHFTAADLRIKDSLWSEYYNNRFSNQAIATSTLRQYRSLEHKYDHQVSQVHFYWNMVFNFAEVNMLDSTKVYVDSIWHLMETDQLKAKNLQASAYSAKGLYFAGNEEWDSAVSNNLHALDLLRSCPDKTLQLSIADALSLAYLRQGNFKMAVHHYLPFIEDVKDSKNVSRSFDIMLNIFGMTFDSHDDSLMRIGKDYLFAAKRLADSVTLKNAQPALDYNLASYYFGVNNTDSGMYYSRRVIDYLKADSQMDNQLQMAYSKIVRRFIDEGRYSEAKAAFKELQRNVDTTILAKQDMSEYWTLAYELEKRFGTPSSTLEALTQLKAVDDENYKYEKNDKLIKYEVKMTQLRNENFIKAKEYEAKNQKSYVIFATIISILTFACSIYIYYYWKKKQALENRYWIQLQKRKEADHQNQLLEERTRISREMHDDLGTTLTSALMAVEMIKMFPNNEKYNEMASSSVNNLFQQINEIIWNLNVQDDNINSLNSYMISFARGFLEQANIELLFEEFADDELKVISSFQRRMIYLSFKELINNIVKHAQATQVKVRIETRGDNYYLCIEDNGVGIEAPVDADENATCSGSGYGLGNVNRNISRLFGTVRWQPVSAHGGTRVDINLNILAS